MARTKLDLPEKFHFSTNIPVRISDINYGGHVGNDALLSLIHEARIRFLQNHGYTESNIEGVGTIMVDAVILYKAEAFYGDILRTVVAIDDFTNYSFDVYYRLRKVESDKEVARAKTTIFFFDYQQRKTARTPEKFKAIFLDSRS